LGVREAHSFHGVTRGESLVGFKVHGVGFRV